MVTKTQIDCFLSFGPVAVAGVSRNKKKFGYTAYKEVQNKGLTVVPINPHIDSIDGVQCFKSVSALPDEVDALWIVTKRDQTAGVVREALEKGIQNIWIQQMSDTPEAISLVDQTRINLITRQCMLMHFKAHGIHKFHRGFKRFFRRLPT